LLGVGSARCWCHDMYHSGLDHLCEPLLLCLSATPDLATTQAAGCCRITKSYGNSEPGQGPTKTPQKGSTPAYGWEIRTGRITSERSGSTYFVARYRGSSGYFNLTSR
jgi:hypothetical protein